MMRVTRVYRFSASHRLHSDQMSEEANHELYGKCNNPWGHGHDYVLHIGVCGEADPGTGRVVNPGVLDEYVGKQVLELFNHRNINEDVAGFQGVPTTENLAHDVEQRLRRYWDDFFAPLRLDRILIQETPRNRFELRMG